LYNQALQELENWQAAMQRPPSFFNKTSKGIQHKINRLIPERIHKLVTGAIKQMVRAVIFGAGFTTTQKPSVESLQEAESLIKKRIRFYRSTAGAEGAVTGAGGFLLAIADFPLWLSLKMKMLFEIASRYGFDVKDYRERIFILYIFQLAFSSQKRRNEVYQIIANWEIEKEKLPTDIHKFDWRTFQLEYRDYIDLAKLLQLIPGFGALVGAFVNHQLTSKLGKFAMNAYRLRLKKELGITYDLL